MQLCFDLYLKSWADDIIAFNNFFANFYFDIVRYIFRHLFVSLLIANTKEKLSKEQSYAVASYFSS